MTIAEIERFRRIERVFDSALDFPAGPAREMWLREACGGDDGLVREVAFFLLEHDAMQVIVPEAEEPMPRFGAWQALRLLGRGGMGTVYLADRSDGAFQMRAAVKIVPLALASLDIEERFRRERQFLASLDHPKIARLIDGGVSGHGIPWLAMEFVDGLSIERFSRERKLASRECAALVRQLMEALVYIHGQHVVHRDLKPSNILVDGEGRLKLLDFGTARLAEAGGGDAITQSGVFALTPAYASPEQIAGRIATFASDIYSAGLVLRKILPDEKRDRQLGLILAKALQAKPEDRYSTAAEMDLDLERYLAGAPLHAARATWRRLAIPALACFAAICGALGVAAYRHFRAGPGQLSIAVMPFANLSADPANRYFSDGLTDEITDSLARFKTLKVIARSSAFQAKAKTASVRDAGRALHLTNVVEGSVQRSGDRIRIVAHLDRVSDGAVLWTSTIERSASDLFQVQSELARGIAANLRVAGDPSARHVPKPGAYEFAMKGRYDLQQMTPESLTRAEDDFGHAIGLDPEYAGAYANLAVVKYNQAVARGFGMRPDGDRGIIEKLERRALELEPDLSTARVMLATLALQYDWDWSRAERELRAATAGSPDANAESQYAFLLVFRGRFAEADEHLGRMLDLNPFQTVAMSNFAVCRYLEGRFAEARAMSERIAAQAPGMILPREIIGATHILEGHPAQALPVFLQMEQQAPPTRMLEAMAHAAAGRRDEAFRLVRSLEDKYPNPGVAMYYFANFYALLDDQASTLKWLERSADRHEYRALMIGVDPSFTKMRNTPGFRALEHRVGLE